MKRALTLAARAWGYTSPNPAVGAVLARGETTLGEGWHQRAGEPHAEVNAIRSAVRQGNPTQGATLYVTLEPCSTHGRTPPCTEAILQAGIREVVVGAVDPNPSHAGTGLNYLRKRGVRVRSGLLAAECERLNEGFNHWIVHRTPWVILKSAMTLDGKIATRTGESKWITSAQARRFSMRLRRGADAILAGINTVVADDPALTLRPVGKEKIPGWKGLRRVVLDSQARVPLRAQVIADAARHLTTLVVSSAAPLHRIRALEKQVQVWVAPGTDRKISLPWLLEKLGAEQVTSLLIEGGGETASAFLRGSLAHRIYFFYAPLIFGGREARKAIGGAGFAEEGWASRLSGLEWTRLGPDLLLNACVQGRVQLPRT